MFGESRTESHPVFHKTQLCRFHMMGKCTRWKACKFAHSAEELQPLPDFSRTKLCPELREKGRCERGGECAFAHTLAELRDRRGGREEGRAKPGKAHPAAPRPSAAPPQAGRAIEAEAMEAPPLVVLLAQTVPVQLVQVMQMPCAPLPVAAAPSGSEFAGAAFGGDAARGPTQCGQKEPSNPPVVDIEEDFFDVSCGKDEDLDLPGGSWSRQSTDEGSLFEPAAEFSRQSTAEAWEPLEAEGPGEEARCEDAADVDNDVVAESLAPIEEHLRLSFREAAANLGMEFVVKHTFIKFNDQEPLDAPPLRRARSTGELVSCAC